jgi:hypothetical protein
MEIFFKELLKASSPEEEGNILTKYEVLYVVF